MASAGTEYEAFLLAQPSWFFPGSFDATAADLQYTFTAHQYPLAISSLTAVKDNGQIVGNYDDGIPGLGILAGFVDSGGTFTTTAYPGAGSTSVTGSMTGA